MSANHFYAKNYSGTPADNVLKNWDEISKDWSDWDAHHQRGESVVGNHDQQMARLKDLNTKAKGLAVDSKRRLDRQPGRDAGSALEVAGGTVAGVGAGLVTGLRRGASIHANNANDFRQAAERAKETANSNKLFDTPKMNGYHMGRADALSHSARYSEADAEKLGNLAAHHGKIALGGIAVLGAGAAIHHHYAKNYSGTPAEEVLKAWDQM